MLPGVQNSLFLLRCVDLHQLLRKKSGSLVSKCFAMFTCYSLPCGAGRVVYQIFSLKTALAGNENQNKRAERC